MKSTITITQVENGWIVRSWNEVNQGETFERSVLGVFNDFLDLCDFLEGYYKPLEDPFDRNNPF